MIFAHIFSTMKFEDLQAINTVYTGGWYRRGKDDTSNGHLSLCRSVKDIETDSARVILDNFVVSGESDDDIIQVSSNEINKFAVCDVAISGTKRVIIGNPTADKKIFVDIESNGLHMRVDASGVHGNVVADTWFGGCSWSVDERYFCYVAQPFVATEASKAAKPKPEITSTKSVQDTKFDYGGGDWGEKYVNVSQFVICVLDTTTGQVRTVPGIDTENGCPGQPVFVSRGSRCGIVYTYWSTRPRRMGILMCYHRKCGLHHVDLTSFLTNASLDSASESHTGGAAEGTKLTHTCITPDIALARSARFNNSRDESSGCLVFLGRTAPMQTHNGCWQLFAVDVGTAVGGAEVQFSLPRVTVDLVSVPGSRGGSMQFPGLFCDQLPRRCFVADYVIAMNTAWGSSDAAIVVAVGECCRNHITRLTCLLSILPQDSCVAAKGSQFASCSVVEAVGYGSTSASDIVFVTSRPNCPLQFGIYTHQFAPAHTGSSNVRLTTPRGHEDTVLQHGCVISSKHVHVVSTVSTVKADSIGKSVGEHISGVQNKVKNLQWTVLQFSEEVPGDQGSGPVPFEAIVVNPATDAEGAGAGALPVVMVPHGGPHSVFTTNFTTIAPYAYLALELHACVVLVNYRGSVGFGDASVGCLPGHIGERDLSDVLCVMNHLKHDYTGNSYRNSVKLDFNRCCIVGGSHGGFLSATAIGKHPGLFKAAAMRNPVTNIPAMYTVSDIPGTIPTVRHCCYTSVRVIV